MPPSPIQLLTAANLLALHVCQILNIRIGQPKYRDRLGVEIDISCFADCPQRIFRIFGRSNFPGDEDIQREMEVETHGISDRHATARERDNQAVRVVAILLQCNPQSMPGFFTVLEDHDYFLPGGSR